MYIFSSIISDAYYQGLSSYVNVLRIRIASALRKADADEHDFLCQFEYQALQYY